MDSTCSNLWAKTSYCVGAVGDIATYSGYPTTTASYTFTKPPATTYTPVPVPTASLQPVAPGTITGCLIYENAIGSSYPDYTTLNACDTWAIVAGVTVKDLLRWNPSLSSEGCTFQSGYSYCLVSDDIPGKSVGLERFNILIHFPIHVATETLPHDYCFPANTSLISSTSAQPAECGCYIQLRAEDMSTSREYVTIEDNC